VRLQSLSRHVSIQSDSSCKVYVVHEEEMEVLVVASVSTRKITASTFHHVLPRQVMK
jgi:hypothetical protein